MKHPLSAHTRPYCMQDISTRSNSDDETGITSVAATHPFYKASSVRQLSIPVRADASETRDAEYMRRLYPVVTKRIQREVVSACDALDYDGSILYDKYPDKESLLRLATTITKRLEAEDALFSNAADATDAETLHMQQFPGFRPPPGPPPFGPPPRPVPPPFGPPPRPVPPPKPPSNNWLPRLVEVMLFDEILNRRRRCGGRYCR